MSQACIFKSPGPDQSAAGTSRGWARFVSSPRAGSLVLGWPGAIDRAFPGGMAGHAAAAFLPARLCHVPQTRRGLVVERRRRAAGRRHGAGRDPRAGRGADARALP